jgi:hypothetical protein
MNVQYLAAYSDNTDFALDLTNRKPLNKGTLLQLDQLAEPDHHNKITARVSGAAHPSWPCRRAASAST